MAHVQARNSKKKKQKKPTDDLGEYFKQCKRILLNSIGEHRQTILISNSNTKEAEEHIKEINSLPFDLQLTTLED